MALDGFLELLGQLPYYGEESTIILAVVLSLVATGYFAYNAVNGTHSGGRFSDFIRGRSSRETGTIAVAASSEVQSQDEPTQTENQDSQADFRAAGDGWEGEDDIDYVIDEDVLNQVPGAFSDEDSDDDRVALRQILMASDDNTAITPSNENWQDPQGHNTQQPVAYNSAENFGDTETELSINEDTDAETHAFHARNDKHNELSE